MKINHLFFATFLVVVTAVAVTAQSDAKSAFRRGDVLVAQEQYKSAIEEYGKVSSRDREFYARAIYNIGVCYYELWQTEEAIVFYKRAIQLKQGDYPRASYALGVALEDQRRLAEAREAYQNAVNTSRGEFGLAIYKLGLIEARAGEFEKAATLFRNEASREGPQVPASHNNLGVMLLGLGLLKEAEKEFVIALRESDGRLDEAVHNLNLCRSTMATLRQDYRISEN